MTAQIVIRDRRLSKKEIEGLSDPQINAMMTACVNRVGRYEVSEDNTRLTYDSQFEGELTMPVIDFCSNPSALMPVILESNISILKHSDYRTFSAFVVTEIDDYDTGIMLENECRFESENPYRAAALSYMCLKNFI